MPEQPTLAQVMDMLIRLDNKINFLYKKAGLQVNPAFFDRLPDQPMDFFSNIDELTPSKCNKNLSVWHCKNRCNKRTKECLSQS